MLTTQPIVASSLSNTDPPSTSKPPPPPLPPPLPPPYQSLPHNGPSDSPLPTSPMFPVPSLDSFVSIPPTLSSKPPVSPLHHKTNTPVNRTFIKSHNPPYTFPQQLPSSEAGPRIQAKSPFFSQNPLPEIVDSGSAASLLPKLKEKMSKQAFSELISQRHHFYGFLSDCYMKEFDVSGQAIDLALRKFLYFCPLPTEGQKIERLLTSFARHYFNSNRELFNSHEEVVTLFLALTVLNTDAHNAIVTKKMSVEKFIEFSATENITKDLLEILYYNVTMSKFIHGKTTFEEDENGTTIKTKHSPFQEFKNRFVKDPYDTALKNDNQTNYIAMSIAENRLTTCSYQAHRCRNTTVVHGQVPRIVEEHRSKWRPLKKEDSMDTIVHASLEEKKSTEKLLNASSSTSTSAYYGPHLKQTSSAMTVCGIQRISKGRLFSNETKEDEDNEGKELIESITAKISLVKAMHQGTLYRKLDSLTFDKRATLRTWKKFWAVLSGTYLFFFQHGKIFEELLESMEKCTEEERRLFLLSTTPQKPHSIIDIAKSICLVDTSYNKYSNAFKLISSTGRTYMMRSEGHLDVVQWVDKINYLSALSAVRVTSNNFEFKAEGIELEKRENRGDKLHDMLLYTLDQLLSLHKTFFKDLIHFRQLFLLEPLTSRVVYLLDKKLNNRRATLTQMHINIQRLTCYCKIWMDELQEMGEDVEEFAKLFPKPLDPIDLYHTNDAKKGLVLMPTWEEVTVPSPPLLMPMKLEQTSVKPEVEDPLTGKQEPVPISEEDMSLSVTACESPDLVDDNTPQESTDKGETSSQIIPDISTLSNTALEENNITESEPDTTLLSKDPDMQPYMASESHQDLKEGQVLCECGRVLELPSTFVQEPDPEEKKGEETENFIKDLLVELIQKLPLTPMASHCLDSKALET